MTPAGRAAAPLAPLRLGGCEPVPAQRRPACSSPAEEASPPREADSRRSARPVLAPGRRRPQAPSSAQPRSARGMAHRTTTRPATRWTEPPGAAPSRPCPARSSPPSSSGQPLRAASSPLSLPLAVRPLCAQRVSRQPNAVRRDRPDQLLPRSRLHWSRACGHAPEARRAPSTRLVPRSYPMVRLGAVPVGADSELDGARPHRSGTRPGTGGVQPVRPRASSTTTWVSSGRELTVTCAFG